MIRVLACLLMAQLVLASEVPPPEGPWRVHQLSRCSRPAPLLPAEQAS